MPQLPGTDLTVSDLCLGGNVFGWTADEPTSFACWTASSTRPEHAAGRSSTPRSPTATGASERILGAWMADRGVRDRVVVATKASRTRQGAPARRRGEIRAAAERSLREPADRP